MSDDSHNVSVEKLYQRKTLLEQIILRPDTYIGSVEHEKTQLWTVKSFEDEDGTKKTKMVLRDLNYVPGLYKIFDEILVNAADNKQRDKAMTSIKIEIKPEDNMIAVYNNGAGIPVQMHKVEKMWVPSMIFGELLTSSNYDDKQKKVTGGRNGYGAKLCNIFSKKFVAETVKDGKKFKQVWEDHMRKSKEPSISTFSAKDYTKVTFYPDLSMFGMTSLDSDIIDLMSRRAYDVGGTLSGVSVTLNDEKLPFKGFKEYVKLYLDETDFAYEESPEGRWQVAVAPSEEGEFRQVSFVNSIATTAGGKHVDYIVDMILDNLLESVKRKNKEKTNVTKAQARKQLFVFVNCLIENPTFSTQTKENLTLAPSKFGSKCQLSDKFFKKAHKTGIVEQIVNWAENQANKKLENKGARKTGSVNVPKLVDAAFAGKGQSQQCTLILTEGDSAKGLAVSGCAVIGQKYYGIFPLRGKLLNVRDAKAKQIMDNAEINSLIKILGLNYKKTYQNKEDLKDLRYGRIMIMTDQDADGSHIKGLIINFIHSKWPSLLKHSFFQQFITPLIRASKNGKKINFYSEPEFNEWKEKTKNYRSYSIKYYKGLGTSTTSEAKEYFGDLERHRIDFKYTGPEDDKAIILAFSKEMIEARKQWLMDNMEQRKRRRELGLPDVYLYEKGTREITYKDFVNKELVLFSNIDNERSIPSVMDGLKPGQRKVMFTCFKRNDKKEVKVAQLSGSVAEKSAYHHGEVSLQGTIVNLAQDFVGSNNINLLQPIGQFGTRLKGGKDAASARYIYTMLSPLARKIFRPEDDPVLNYLEDENLLVEPEYYVPILPMVLVNGAEGIGTGWSTKVPMYNPLEIVENLKRLILGDDLLPMVPWYRDFRGTREQVGNSVIISGCIRRSLDEPELLEITELPIGTWTENYTETVLKPPADSSVKPVATAVYNFIDDLINYPDDTFVKMQFKMPESKIRDIESTIGLYKAFKLQTSFSLNSMVLFDAQGCLQRYESPLDIIKDFYVVRRKLYEQRREYIISLLVAEAEKLENQARFTQDDVIYKMAGKKSKEKDYIRVLLERGYAPDPVRLWKAKYAKECKGAVEADEPEDEDALTEGGITASDDKNFAYLLTFQFRDCFAEERCKKLYAQRDEKKAQAEKMRRSTIEDLWLNDLDEFEKAYAEWLRGLAKQRAEAREARLRAQRQEVKKNTKEGSRKRKIMVGDGNLEPSDGFEDLIPPLDEFRKKTATATAKRQKTSHPATKPSKLNKVGDDVFDASDSDDDPIRMENGNDEDDDDTIILDDDASFDPILGKRDEN
ncbi:DNA topoisomerase 2-beta, partial [Fragariocoptes setiger]